MMHITEPAKKRIKQIAEREGASLRLSIVGGGCAGFSYKFDLESSDPDASDQIFDDVLFVDCDSLDFLDGATVDYVDDLAGSYLKVDIPTAQSQCGCGTSFSF